MLDRLRRRALRGPSAAEYWLLATAIVAVVLLVAFAFGSFMHGGR